MTLEQKTKYYRLEPEDFIPIYGMSRHKKRVMTNFQKRKHKESPITLYKELTKATLYGSVLTAYNVFVGIAAYRMIMDMLE